VIGTIDSAWTLGTMIRKRPESYAESRGAGRGSDHANQIHRVIEPPLMLETGGEFDNLDDTAILGRQARQKNGAVRVIALFRFAMSLKNDIERSGLVARGKQIAERGIAVKTGKTSPHHPRISIEQVADRTIANDAEFKRRMLTHRSILRCLESRDDRAQPCAHRGGMVERVVGGSGTPCTDNDAESIELAYCEES